MIEESVSSFIKLSYNLHGQLEMAKAKKEVTEELKQSLEEKLEKSIVDNLSLEKELKVTQNKMVETEAKLRKKKKKLHLSEVPMKELMWKSDEVLAQKAITEERAMLAEERAHQAIEKYKKSSSFEDEMTEVGTASYEMGFTDCQDKVSKPYLDLDLWGIIMAEEDEEEGSEQMMAEEPKTATPLK